MRRIKVLLKNGSEEFFPHYILDHVIKRRDIIAFLRSDGWAYLDRDPVRKNPPSEPFQGSTRRISDCEEKRRFTDQILGAQFLDPADLPSSWPDQHRRKEEGER